MGRLVSDAMRKFGYFSGLTRCELGDIPPDEIRPFAERMREHLPWGDPECVEVLEFQIRARACRGGGDLAFLESLLTSEAAKAAKAEAEAIYSW